MQQGHKHEQVRHFQFPAENQQNSLNVAFLTYCIQHYSWGDYSREIVCNQNNMIAGSKVKISVRELSCFASKYKMGTEYTLCCIRPHFKTESNESIQLLLTRLCVAIIQQTCREPGRTNWSLNGSKIFTQLTSLPFWMVVFFCFITKDKKSVIQPTFGFH